MQTQIIKIALIVALSAALVFGVSRIITAYNEGVEAKAAVVILQQEKQEMQNHHDAALSDLTSKYDAVIAANNANSKTVIKTEKALKEAEKHATEIETRYARLISNGGWRLRDRFEETAVTDSSAAEVDSGASERGDTATEARELSKGLTEYIVKMAIDADFNTDHLKVVQEYAIDQHAWILQHCNAVEVTQLPENEIAPNTETDREQAPGIQSTTD